MTPALEHGERVSLAALARLCVWLGATAFGGPAAHIAILHDEVVERRGWIDEQEFLDLLGAVNLLPGPNSTELVIHVGYRTAGWRGLLVAGTGFILPAAAIVLAFAWLYVRYGSTPAGEGVLLGVKPVVIVIVLSALLKLGRKALDSAATLLVAIAVVLGELVGLHELLLLAAGGAAVVAARSTGMPSLLGLLPFGAVGLIQESVPVGLGRLGWVFLKVGSVLYGSGYVLLAFLRGDLVQRLGWLTEQQLLDAIAIGQFTPGPVFTTATFIGYVLAGVPGAVVATVGIFLPAFLLVAAADPLVRRIRSSAVASGLLDGVVAAALGLMAAVLVLLANDAIVDLRTAAIGVGAALLTFVWRVPSVWVMLGGAAAGLALTLVA